MGLTTKPNRVAVPPVFLALCREWGIGEPVAEYKFCTERNWRFDYAFIANKVALEVDGGVWTRGRHTRGAGFIRDNEKLNRAAALGWRVIRVTPQQFAAGEMMADLAEAMTRMV